MSWYSFRPYVPVAQRRAQAARKLAQLQKKGRKISPVRIEGRTIARTFWGQAWCTHLESYSDYANRLPRGRSYLRNGSVIDLQIEPAKVVALVNGSSLYKVEVNIKPLAAQRWAQIRTRCSGHIGTLIELLQGRLSKGVMQIITARDAGLFPAPAEISLNCSCPDWAGMCKHVAAVLYGVGARLDDQPDLLFTLRQVNHLDLIAQAADVDALTQASSPQKTICAGDLADVFGIELETGPVEAPPSPPTTLSVAVAGKPKAAVQAVDPQAAALPKAPVGMRMKRQSKARMTDRASKPSKPAKTVGPRKAAKKQPLSNRKTRQRSMDLRTAGESTP